MAILEKATQKYYKLNLDKCCVQFGNIMLDVTIYESIDARRKEQTNAKPQQIFFKELQKYTNELVNTLKTKLQSIANSTDLIEKPESPYYNDIQTIQRFSQYVYSLKQRILEHEQIDIEIDERDIPILKSLGYNEDWITESNPILGGFVLNAGEYRGENLTSSFLYNKLTEYMNQSIIEGC